MRTVLRLFPLLAILLLSACNDSGGSDNRSPRTVVAMGDSITGDVNYPGVPPWPSLVRELRPEWNVINAGKGNERSSTGRAKVGALLGRHRPDVLVVMYGTVNAIHGDTGGFEGDLRAIVAAGRDAGARVLLCTVPPATGRRIGLASSIERVNNTIRAVASSEAGVTLVDIFREFGPNSDRFPDGLHPDLDGQRIIAISVIEKI